MLINAYLYTPTKKLFQKLIALNLITQFLSSLILLTQPRQSKSMLLVNEFPLNRLEKKSGWIFPAQLFTHYIRYGRVKPASSIE